MSENQNNNPAAPTPAVTGPAATPEMNPAPPPPTEAEVKDLREKAAKADENWDKYLRSVAELENYRKRVLREREETIRATQERVVAALLPVLDNFERALAAAEQSQADSKSFQDGIRQIQAQFRRALEEFGLQEVAVQAGQAFDPNLHEAVGQVEHPEHPEGAVAEQLQRGYKLSHRLLRPARVVVSKGKSARK